MLAVAPASAQLAAGDADIVAAKAAFDRGDAQALAAAAPRTRGHVLAPYVTYWQFELAIDSADPAALRAFVLAWPGTPFADKLRADWQKSLARRADWTRFGQDYALPAATDDVELACASIHYRRQRDGDDVMREVIPLWFTGQATPDLCEPLFTTLIARKAITTADRVARVRLASEAGNVRVARMLAEALPADQRAQSAAFLAIDRNPLRALPGPYKWHEGGSHILALYALERAARSDAAAARAPWVKLRGNLTAAERAYGNGRIAYHAARQLVPEADAGIAKAMPTHQQRTAHVARARRVAGTRLARRAHRGQCAAGACGR